jgi:hypothetical protein
MAKQLKGEKGEWFHYGIVPLFYLKSVWQEIGNPNMVTQSNGRICNLDFTFKRLEEILHKNGVSSFKMSDKISIEEIESGLIGIKLYNNFILKFHNNEIVELFAKPWYTNTSLEKLNIFMPKGYYIFRWNSLWYLKMRKVNRSFPFRDGMFIDLNNRGRVCNFLSKKEENILISKLNTIQIYTENYIDNLIEKRPGTICCKCDSCILCSGLKFPNLKQAGENENYRKEYIKHIQERFQHIYNEHIIINDNDISILVEALNKSSKVSPMAVKVFDMLIERTPEDSTLMEAYKYDSAKMYYKRMFNYILHLGGFHVISP